MTRNLLHFWRYIMWVVVWRWALILVNRKSITLRASYARARLDLISLYVASNGMTIYFWWRGRTVGNQVYIKEKSKILNFQIFVAEWFSYHPWIIYKSPLVKILNTSKIIDYPIELIRDFSLILKAVWLLVNIFLVKMRICDRYAIIFIRKIKNASNFEKKCRKLVNPFNF